MHAWSLHIADTRAFILGIRRVLLGLPQHLGEGQLHVLVYCFQQEVSEHQEQNTGHSEASKGQSQQQGIFSHHEQAESQTNHWAKDCSSSKACNSHRFSLPSASSLPFHTAPSLSDEAKSRLLCANI